MAPFLNPLLLILHVRRGKQVSKTCLYSLMNSPYASFRHNVAKTFVKSICPKYSLNLKMLASENILVVFYEFGKCLVSVPVKYKTCQRDQLNLLL